MPSSIEILKTQSETRGAQYLVALLLANDYVLRVLCDASLSREQAIAVGRAAVRLDSMADIKLARRLAEGAETGVDLVSPAEAVRLLEVLGDISPGTRLLPSLVRLLRHNDPNLRSKVVLLVGRANKSARWTSQCLSDPDSRIRANAVEGLWGVDSDSARKLLQNAASDWNNRVAGNALLGLYRLGDSSTIPEILGMAGHESVLFRSTAAWVMGESEDPRFLENLAAMLREPSAVVRKRAFSALRKIKAGVQTSRAVQWLLAGRFPAHEQQKAIRRLLLTVACDAGKQPPSILPTHFILSENGRPVNKYKVVDRAVPETQAVVFVFAKDSELVDRPGRKGAQLCLQWKRASDFWACLYYLHEDPDGLENQHVQNEPPSYQSNTEAAEADLLRVPPKVDCADVWHTLGRIIYTENSNIRGKRHIILVNPSPSHGSPNPELAAALASRATLQVISAVPDPTLEALCARVQGSFEVAKGEEQIPELVAGAYLRLMSRYEITWRPVYVDANEIRVKVHHAMGSGEILIPVPPPPRA